MLHSFHHTTMEFCGVHLVGVFHMDIVMSCVLFVNLLGPRGSITLLEVRMSIVQRIIDCIYKC